MGKNNTHLSTRIIINSTLESIPTWTNCDLKGGREDEDDQASERGVSAFCMYRHYTTRTAAEQTNLCGVQNKESAYQPKI